MKIYAIGDLHLSTKVQKPMDIFGEGWDNHFQRIETDWLSKVNSNDIVLIPGDISWGMYLEEAQADLDLISKLPGIKIFIRGNHDYWWNSITAVRNILKDNNYALQNDAIRLDDKVVICGTRGWTVPEKENQHKTPDDEKIYKRELIRLELALQDLDKKRKEGDISIVMLHFPPFNAKMLPSDFTRLCEKYKIDYVVYGHLHGKNCRCKLKLIQHNLLAYKLRPNSVQTHRSL